MYIAMGHERAGEARPHRAVARSTTTSTSWWTRSRRSTPRRRAWSWPPARRSHYDQLVIATGVADRPRGDRGLRARRPTTSTPPRPSAKLRKALDAFTGGKIVIGIAGIPYKCPPAPLEVAFLVESELRERGLRDKTEIQFLSPINRAFTIESVSEMATPIFEEKGIDLQLLAGVD